MDENAINQALESAASYYRSFEEGRWQAENRQANAWQVEAVRHLALLDGAALAGSVALLAADRYGSVLLLPMMLFLLAYAVLVFGMHCATVGFSKRASDYVARIELIDRVRTATGAATNSVDQLSSVMKITKSASRVGQKDLDKAVMLARLSAVLFCVGAALLLAILLYK